MKPINTFAAVLLASSLVPGAVLAAGECNLSAEETKGGLPSGLRGMDPVGPESRMVPPSVAEHTAVHDGVSYYFASPEAKAAFEVDPLLYLPQFDRFCTYAVSLGRTFDGDLRYADIVDGQLYVFVDGQVFATYKKDRAAILGRTVATWTKIQHAATGNL